MRAWLTLLTIFSTTSAGFLGGTPSSKPSVVSKKPGPGAALAPTTGTTFARSAIVPVLSYTGLGLAAAGAGHMVTSAGFASTTLVGLPMPSVTLAAIVAPAAVMLAEFLFFGGGERVAKMMGGEPADASLAALVSNVARRAGLEPPAHVYEIPTGELNAFAAGFGKGDSTVAITSGLRRTLNRNELEAVIAHELGHICHSDMRTNMHVAIAIAGLGGIYEIGRFLVESESRKPSNDDDDSQGTWPLGVSLMAAGIGSRVVAQLLKLSMSRSAEFDADRVAAELCGSDAMISALSKIQSAAESKSFWSSEGETQPALSSIRGGVFAHAYISDGKSDNERRKTGFWSRVSEAFSTHPTTERRIAALRAKSSARAR